ncbi:MAG: hypothetical protein H8E74_02060 [Gammaproteobacteria bacterium]|nr:hypothetical protein [Gammaproteobacteria bacterium]
MKEGISSYPKHFLLILLSDVTEMLHKMGKTVISEELEDSHKVRIFEELLLSKDAALLYLTINKIMEKISKNENELANIRAELKLHMDTHSDSYQDIHNIMADAEIAGLIKATGLTLESDNDSEEDDSTIDD